MEQYLCGIDVGTSACKVAIFNKDGEVLGSASSDYVVKYPKPGWAEQNPEDWWAAVGIAIHKVLTKNAIDSAQIAGIGIDGQGWSAVAIDAKGNVLMDTPIWMDTRAQEICDELNGRIGTERIFQLTGNSLQPSYTTAKILWYQKYKPEQYKKIYKVLQSNSFIAYRLTGMCSQDICQCYGYHCFDMRKGKWDDAMCKEMGIPREFLPDIVACHDVVGRVTKAAADKTGLKEGTPVVAGGLDAACGALGAGVVHPGETQEQGGQAGGMSVCMDRYAANPALILGFHVVPEQWLLQGGTTGGGGVMRWVEREFAQYERMCEKEVHKSSLTQLNEIAEEVVPGSDGLVFLPYMSGERSPIWNPDAKGVYYGLDFSKTKGHIVRAAMEGVVFALKHNIDTAEETGVKIDVLRSMGGSANSLLWTQMKADVTGKSIVVPSSDTATTLGAAILAGVGVGVYNDFEEAVEKTVKVMRTHEPNEKLHPVYEENYKVYLKLYENLKGLMDQRRR